MLPSPASTKDFYACGARVQVPNIRVSNKTKKWPNSVSTAAPLAPLDCDSRLGNSGYRRRHTVGGEREALRSHVGQLKQALTFSDDVVSSISPQAVSYCQARGCLDQVFRPGPLTRRRRVRLPGGDVGRHSCRGEVRQHRLCHLRSTTVPHTTSDRDRHHAMTTTHITQRSPSLLPVRHGDVASYPSDMLYREMRVVPANSSVHWEAELLKRVTSSTAARLGAGETAKKREREREEVSEAITARGKGGVGDRVEVENREHRTREYVRSLEDGAKPVTRGEGERSRRDVIVLDNDTTFTKV